MGIRRVSSTEKWQTNFVGAIIAIIIGTGFIVSVLGVNSDLAHALLMIGFLILGLGIGVLLRTRTIAKLERKLQLARNQQPQPPTKKWQPSSVGAIIAIIIGTGLIVSIGGINSDRAHALALIAFLIVALCIGVLLSNHTIDKLTRVQNHPKITNGAI